MKKLMLVLTVCVFLLSTAKNTYALVNIFENTSYITNQFNLNILADSSNTKIEKTEVEEVEEKKEGSIFYTLLVIRGVFAVIEWILT